ncbi:hypothetical protein ACO2Q2_17120 [Dyella sp. KRB-257]|uniref:hypothetical protein n=1 Tax=Dyella sp. KRB-257 TaxID=3400915 RepID=UPI003BFFD50E
MIRMTPHGTEQFCRRCKARGYADEDCWWPITEEFWYRRGTNMRVTQWSSECKACVSERGLARKAAAREQRQQQVAA